MIVARTMVYPWPETQFHEFLETLAGAYTADGAVKVPNIDFQPIAASDVAAALVEIALGRRLITT
ncbi:hypothetical protein [Rhizobium sp. Rhizsp42]|uniref:hypothetical protein n=1 Tax=Rhizobium sp. Rhizsp42 TaxID=3243034 RepID=UPI0039AFCC44